MNVEEIYLSDFNVKGLSQGEKKKFSENRLKTFPVWLTVILGLITFNIFSTIYMGIQHGRLPKIKKDDFGAGKAIGFLFIPFFNYYWIFMFWMKLIDKINLQLSLRGIESRVPKGLGVTIPTLTLASGIPLLGIITAIVNWLIIIPITTGLIQKSINEILQKK